MPYTKRKLKSGRVRVTSPNGVKSKGSTPENAEKQVHLLQAVDHGWKPTHRDNIRKKMGV